MYNTVSIFWFTYDYQAQTLQFVKFTMYLMKQQCKRNGSTIRQIMFWGPKKKDVQLQEMQPATKQK